MSVPDFQPWPKIARLNRTIVVTEKIDGTNAAVVVTPELEVWAQSRKRTLNPDIGVDNFGFGSWVMQNADELRRLGPGYHYGEWHGLGIQRGYGLFERRFALFNTDRWGDEDVRPTCCDVVPVLYQGTFSGDAIDECVADLLCFGSRVNNFPKAEGIVVYHTAARTSFKVTLDNDQLPKGVQ